MKLTKNEVRAQWLELIEKVRQQKSDDTNVKWAIADLTIAMERDLVEKFGFGETKLIVTSEDQKQLWLLLPAYVSNDSRGIVPMKKFFTDKFPGYGEALFVGFEQAFQPEQYIDASEQYLKDEDNVNTMRFFASLYLDTLVRLINDINCGTSVRVA